MIMASRSVSATRTTGVSELVFVDNPYWFLFSNDQGSIETRQTWNLWDGANGLAIRLPVSMQP